MIFLYARGCFPLAVWPEAQGSWAKESGNSYLYLCSSTYFQQKSILFLCFQILSPYICRVLTVVRADILVKSVLKILSLVGIWTISKNEDNKQETLTLLLYTCLDTADYIPIGVGYCLLLILRQSRASNKVILNSSYALFCI